MHLKMLEAPLLPPVFSSFDANLRSNFLNLLSHGLVYQLDSIRLL